MMKIWWNRHDQILRDNNSPLDMRWIWTLETSEMDQFGFLKNKNKINQEK